MLYLIICVLLVLFPVTVLAKEPTRAEQRKEVMEYLCKNDPTLCKQRGWLKPFEDAGS